VPCYPRQNKFDQLDILQIMTLSFPYLRSLGGQLPDANTITLPKGLYSLFPKAKQIQTIFHFLNYDNFYPFLRG